MKRERSMFVVLAVVSFVLCNSSCAALRVVDTVGPSQPKGYVSFYADLIIDINAVDGPDEVLVASNHSFWGGQARELRIAKPPGTYRFVVRHYDRDAPYSVAINVEIKPNRISYVTVDAIVLSVSTSYNSSETITRMRYVVSTSVGETPLPLVPRSENLREILAALADADWATRFFALKALEQAKLNPGPPGIAQIKTMADSDHKEQVRKAAVHFLKSIGEAAPPEPLFLETFENNRNDWPTSRTQRLHSYFNGFGYNMDHNSGTSHWATTRALGRRDLQGNYDVEAEAVWKSGIDNYGFGVLLGEPPTDLFKIAPSRSFYDFCVSRNGGAIVHRVMESAIKSTPIDWDYRYKAELQQTNSYLFRIEVRGASVAFSMNGFPVGTVTLEGAFSPAQLGLIVYEKQNVLFKWIKIIAR